MSDCRSIVDPKIKGRQILYAPRDFNIPAAQSARLAKCGVTAQPLPKIITAIGDLQPGDIPRPGLLYLPNPYVVPGGRFNEMYGWDSYFIVLGLLRDGQDKAARDMIENFFFEIDHYGTFLNANRTYYFTRSQPPFLTSMIRAYYEHAKAAGRTDAPWLERAYGYTRRNYETWTREPHLAGDTGLARYFDVGEGPVPETGDDPSYYLEVASYLLAHPEDQDYGYLNVPAETPDSDAPNSNAHGSSQAAGPAFALRVCADSGGGGRPCSSPKKVSLTGDYYRGDRAMRESGFDISFRFGPFSGSTHHFAPVCLNSLLYKAETDMAEFAAILNKPEEASRWRERAGARRAAINKYFWDAGRGLFFDYDFMRRRQSSYNYAATFYPLWAGLATPEQAQAVAGHLNVFEKPGGVAMSDRNTGVQWDLPYGWAPIQLIASEGLRSYGFHEAADRIAREFASMVRENFERDGTIREKYNVATRSSETKVRAGYADNVVGFGWTNGVVLELLHDLGR